MRTKSIYPLGDELFETWSAETVVTADLVIGSLLKQARDIGIAGREIADFVSLDDIDGPAKTSNRYYVNCFISNKEI